MIPRAMRPALARACAAGLSDARLALADTCAGGDDIDGIRLVTPRYSKILVWPDRYPGNNWSARDRAKSTSESVTRQYPGSEGLCMLSVVIRNLAVGALSAARGRLVVWSAAREQR